MIFNYSAALLLSSGGYAGMKTTEVLHVPCFPLLSSSVILLLQLSSFPVCSLLLLLVCCLVPPCGAELFEVRAVFLLASSACSVLQEL